MKRMLTAVAIVGIVLLAVGGLWAEGQESDVKREDHPLPTLMFAKLASTQTIAAGLVSQDFERIRRGASELARICDAGLWQSNADQVYTHHRVELRRQALKLAQLAEDQNLDGAAFAYMHSMSTCISCHQYCRDVLRIADRAEGSSGVIRIPTVDDGIDWQRRPSSRR